MLGQFPELRPFSSGSAVPAAFLIERAGLKGERIGNACISRKHANYFVNDGNASAENVLALISLAKDRVRRTFGISLEEEVHFVSHH